MIDYQWTTINNRAANQVTNKSCCTSAYTSTFNLPTKFVTRKLTNNTAND